MARLIPEEEVVATGRRLVPEAEVVAAQAQQTSPQREYALDELYGQELRIAPDLAEATGEPTAKFRSGAHARRGMLVSPAMAEDPMVQAAAAGERVTQPAGKPTAMMGLIDIMDAVTSPVSRPMNAATSARADLNTFRGMDSADRRAWADRLHPDDPRKSAYAELASALDKQEAEGGGLVDRAVGGLVRSLERSVLGPLAHLLGAGPSATPQVDVERAVDRLALKYWLPNMADPYGGTGLPRPWQDTDGRGRLVKGTKPADLIDVVLRGLASGPASAEERAGTRAEIQQYGAMAQGAALGLFKPGDRAVVDPRKIIAEHAIGMLEGAPGLVGKASAYRESAEDAISKGDTRKGLFLPEVAYMMALDLGATKTPLGAALGMRTKAVQTGAGLMTEDGAKALSAQRREAAASVMDTADKAALARGEELTSEARRVLMRDAVTSVDALFATASRDALRKGKVVEALDVRAAVSIGDDGRVVVDHGKVVRQLADEGVDLFEESSTARSMIDRAIRNATTSGDGTARVLVIPGVKEPLELGRLGIEAAERVRSGFRPLARAFEPFGVRDPSTGAIRPIKTSDLVGENVWRAVQSASTGKRRSFHAIAHETDEAAFAVRKGQATKEQEKVVTRLLEELGNPSPHGDIGAEFVRTFEDLIMRTIRVIPGDRLVKEEARAAKAAKAAADRLNNARATADAARSAVENAADPQAARARVRAAEADLRAAEKEALKFGGDGEGLRTAAAEAKKARDKAFVDLQGAVKNRKAARGTADEAAARAEQKRAQQAAAEAEAASYQAEHAARKAKGGGVPPEMEQRLKDLKARAASLGNEAKAAKESADKARRAANAAEAEWVDAAAARRAAQARADDVSEAVAARADVMSRRTATLKDPLLQAMEIAAETAQAGRDLLRSLTGFASADELVEVRRLQQAMDDALERSSQVIKDAEFHAAVQGMTFAQARQAERAVTRVLGRLEKQAGESVARQAARDFAKAEWDALPDTVQKAAQGARDYFEHMYRTLKAEGRLPGGWDKDAFLERMRVEGYVRHVLSRGGKKMLRQIRRQYDLSTDLDLTLRRKKAGTIGEVNEAARTELAEMVWDHAMKKGGTPEHIGKAPAEALDQIIAEHGLDAINFFETDAVAIMRQYGRDVARSTSNARFIDSMRVMFPEGDRFAAMAKKPTTFGLSGIQDVDVAAAQAGFRRVGGVSHAHAVLAETAWEGWAKNKAQLDNILKQGTSEERVRALNKFLDDAGIARDSVIRKEAEVIADTLYVPEQIADFIEGISDPKWRERWSALGWAGESFDALTNFFKTSVTIGALAFHGRNIVSNTLQGVMMFGAKALSPINQMDAIAILNGHSDARYSLRVGNVTEEKAIGEWRRELRESGILTDKVTMADVDETFESMRVNTAQGFVSMLVGGAAGGAAGAATGDDAGERLRHGLAGAMGGAIGGGALKGGFDVYGQRAFRAKQAGASWREAFDKVIEDALPVLNEGHKAATAAATLTAGAAAAAPGIGAAAPVAAYASVLVTKLGGEGFFKIAGGLGQAVEQQARIANYLTARKAGHSAFEAAELVNKTLFDYDDLTNFERHVLRRVFPFYTWTSRNALELQPFLAAQRPAASTALNKILMAASKVNLEEEDLSLLDEHLRYRFVMNLGFGKLLAGFGLPIESVAELLKPGASGLRSMMHPIVPFIERFGAGVDPYYNVELKEIRTARDVLHLPGLFQRAVGFHPSVLKNPSQYLKGKDPRVVPEIGWYQKEDGGWYQDPERGAATLALLRSFPPWRLVTEFNKTMNESFMRGVGSGDGPEAGPGERIAALLTGTKPYSVNWDDLGRKAWYRIQTALEDKMLDLGKLRETTYPTRQGVTAATPLEDFERLHMVQPSDPTQPSTGGQPAP